MFQFKKSKIKTYLNNIAGMYTPFDHLLSNYLSGELKNRLAGLGLQRLSIYIDWLPDYKCINIQGRYQKNYVDVQIEQSSFSIGCDPVEPDDHTEYVLDNQEQFYDAVQEQLTTVATTNMLLTPLGTIRILGDEAPITFTPRKASFDRSPVGDKPLAGCYRIKVKTNNYHSISCVVELSDSSILNTGSSGERYLDAEFISNSSILTIGMEDDNDTFQSVRLPMGLQYILNEPVEHVIFGVAWATDYYGADDVRTWFAADPTMDSGNQNETG